MRALLGFLLRYSPLEKETPIPTKGNSIFSEEILDVCKTCSLEIQHPQ